MSLSFFEQAKRELQASQAILVVLPQQPTIDALASALVLRAFLMHAGKKADIVCDGFMPSDRHAFLMDVAKVQHTMPSVQKCIITVDKRRFPVADVGYTTNEDTLRIFVTPKSGLIPSDAIRVYPGGYAYDLIVTINLAELASAGNAYEQHKPMFQTVPLLNIDHRADNEQYGQINWLDILSTSTSEMVCKLIESDQHSIDATTATALLAGIMEETHSFRTPQVTPATLETVSRLLKAGADHASVTQHLYRTKTVGGLKLWGHVLTHLQADRQTSLAWSLVPASLFAVTGTSTQQLQELMTEILSHSPEARTVILFVEQASGKIEVQITAKAPLHAKDLIKDWQPRGSERFAQATVTGKTLVDCEAEVVATVKRRLQSVSGL